MEARRKHLISLGPWWIERRACARGHARRRVIRVRRAGRSPVKRRSASGECAPLRECDSAERESIEPRFLLVGAALAKKNRPIKFVGPMRKYLDVKIAQCPTVYRAEQIAKYYHKYDAIRSCGVRFAYISP